MPTQNDLATFADPDTVYPWGGLREATETQAKDQERRINAFCDTLVGDFRRLTHQSEYAAFSSPSIDALEERVAKLEKEAHHARRVKRLEALGIVLIQNSEAIER